MGDSDSVIKTDDSALQLPANQRAAAANQASTSHAWLAVSDRLRAMNAAV
jgi:hypothetical protein